MTFFSDCEALRFRNIAQNLTGERRRTGGNIGYGFTFRFSWILVRKYTQLKENSFCNNYFHNYIDSKCMRNLYILKICPEYTKPWFQRFQSCQIKRLHNDFPYIMPWGKIRSAQFFFRTSVIKMFVKYNHNHAKSLMSLKFSCSCVALSFNELH